MDQQDQESRNPVRVLCRLVGSALCFLLLILSPNLFAATKTKPIRVARQPFVSFRSIDLRLTTIDHDLQELASRIHQAGELHSAHQRSLAITHIRNSKTVRSLRKSAASVLAISREVELHYRKRRQRYGVVLFASLRGKATRMVRTEAQIGKASTIAQLSAAHKQFAGDLLTFVLQFQAVSGGYGALQCGAGEWACCQPRSTEQGTVTLRGCTWICTTRRSACKAGCLGPHVPKGTKAALNNARKNSQAK
jgi:hypothetical protein